MGLSRRYRMKKMIAVPVEKCELEGPYECPHCRFHMMLDATYLDQVSLRVPCPSCNEHIEVPE